MHALYSTLLQELHSFAKKQGFQKATLGLSGGLDSAMVLSLATRAFGPKNVRALLLPEMGITPKEDIERARLLCQYFDCPYYYQPINNFLVDYQFIPWETTQEIDDHLKSRIRAGLIQNFAENSGAMLIGTANKSDLALGLGHGDGEWVGALHILGDVFKSDVIELGRSIGLPAELTESGFSRHLHPKQSDEDDLGGPWSKIDELLKQIDRHNDPDILIEKGMDALLVHKIMRLVQLNEGLNKNLPLVQVGQIHESIKKAQKAEAESLK